MTVYEVELWHTYDNEKRGEYWNNLHQSFLFSSREKAEAHIARANAPRDVERVFENDDIPATWRSETAIRQFMCLDGDETDIWSYEINERQVL